MSKPAFVEMVEKDMKWQAEDIVKSLSEYANKICVEEYFVYETFIKEFKKQVELKGENNG